MNTPIYLKVLERIYKNRTIPDENVKRKVPKLTTACINFHCLNMTGKSIINVMPDVEGC